MEKLMEVVLLLSLGFRKPQLVGTVREEPIVLTVEQVGQQAV